MRPVTLDLSQVKDPAVKAALTEIQRASIDTLQNDTSSSGSAMATLIGASADQIAYFTGPTSTAFTALSTFIRTLLGAADAATARSTLGAGTGSGSVTSIATTAPLTGGPITTTGTIGFDTTALPMHLLNTLTASNSPNLDDTTNITAAYDEYMFVLRNVVPATNNTGLLMRLSTSATFRTATYISEICGGIGSASLTFRAEGATNGIMLSGQNVSFDGINNSGTYGLNGVIHLHAPALTTGRKMVTGSTGWTGGGATPGRSNMGTLTGIYDGDSLAVDGVRFLMASGNITSGTIKVYGLKTS